ncbi:MAG: hypothetical protein AMJ90_01630 [candidate division Zixibacteria bacterium SM23_73_2]|nr:MAG: hypothetical protein AMJ90_01630 [candidate division Zixibacteria bacterium SM23_73_2]
MEKYKCEFIEFLVKKKALEFGEFVLKSKRISPYFFNTGKFDDGESVSQLGYFYAKKITEDIGVDKFDILFGPAYKGIPLALATSIALKERFEINRSFAFDRKIAKDHGEKGLFVGAKIEEGKRILILDDVFTTGETKQNLIDAINSVADVSYAGVLISLDREEKDDSGKSAIAEFTQKTKIPVLSILKISEVTEYLYNKEIDGKIYIDSEVKKKLDNYLSKYGI